MDKREIIRAAIKAVPSAAQYSRAIKEIEQEMRDSTERRLWRSIVAIDRIYLDKIRQYGARNLPFGFWDAYRADLARAIDEPLRKYIDAGFTNYSDYAAFIDQNLAKINIETAARQAIDRAVLGISNTTQDHFNALVSQGMSDDDIILNIAGRFSDGHAEQVAITELTRAEGYFSDALQSRLQEQGVETVIRWQTSEDEKVCPICGPADHKLKDEPIDNIAGGWHNQSWGERYGRPPAHPRCRCKTVVELAYGKNRRK